MPVAWPTAAQYANLGVGAQKDKIWWIDWSGFSFANGSTKSFTTSNGLTVTLGFSNVSGPALTPTIMNTWSGSVLHLLYNFSDPAIKPALYHTSYQTELTKFTINVTASRNGFPVPVRLIAADAEASALTEITTLKTNGSNWITVDFFRNSNQTTNPLTGCNTNTLKITDTYGNAPAFGQNPVISTESPATGPLSIEVTMDHTSVPGQMGLAFGILEAVDRGDLPASYGFAHHGVQYAYNNVCSYMPPFPNSVQSTNLKIGNNAGDPDGIQGSDDNANGIDEDGIASFPAYSGSGTYTLTLPVTNTTGGNAFLTGWFDFNGNNAFDGGESVTVTLPQNTTSASLTWSGLPVSLSSTVNYAFRFRLSSSSTAVQVAAGHAPDGEVEDYTAVFQQTTAAGFLTPDTICINSPLSITNTSIGASSYYWNFCVANSTTNPTGVNLGNFGFSLPVFMDYEKDGNNYYAFVTNNMPGKLTRLDFGNSLLNTPTVQDFGNLGGAIPDQCEGIQLVKDNGRWYAIIVGGQPVGRIVKVDFGTSLSNNAPVATNWGNVGNLAYPTDLHVFKDGVNWYGLTINALTNTITRFNFTSSFINTPTGLNLGNIGGLNFPTGIYAIKKNNLWHAFVSNAGNGGSNSSNASLTRLDFGNSLLNTPTGTNIGNPGNLLSSSRDITIYQSCDEIFGFVVNNAGSKELVRLNFNNSLTTPPTAINLGNTGALSFPHSVSKLFRVDNDLYAFVTNVNNNSLTRLKLGGCGSASMPSSTLQNPGPISYNAIGTYSINLTVDDGLPTQSAYCKTVVVIDNTHTPLQNKSFCTGDSVLLTSTKPGGNLWSTGSTSSSIYVKSPGTYWVRSTVGGCINVDSFVVQAKPVPMVNLGVDTSVCSSDSLVLSAGNSGANYSWQNGQSTETFVVKNAGLYYVTVSQNGCSASDSINVSIAASPIITITKDTAICNTESIQLTGSGGQNYSWYPTTALSNPLNASTAASPDTTTTYFLTVTNSNGCKAKDSVKVTVTAKPIVNIGPDTTLCSLDSLLLDAGNVGASYLWQDGKTTRTFVVSNSGLYHVSVNNNGCIVKDSVLVSEILSPVINLSPDTTICKTGQAVLSGSGGVTFSWSPANNLTITNDSTVIVTPEITTVYRLEIIGQNNCVTSDSVTVFVNPKPVFSAGSAQPILCVGDTTVLSASGGDRYTWLPATGLSNPTAAVTQAYSNQSMNYQVIIEDDDCRMADTLSIVLPIADKPIVSVSKSNDITCVQSTATLSASGGVSYSWQPATGLSNPLVASPSVSIPTSTTYQVTITSGEGCTTMDTIRINVYKDGDGSGFLVPSAFTPNNDGKNDCFGVPHWGDVKDFSLSVYNRWGEMVFHADQPSKCWNGFYKGVLQPNAVFVYFIKGKALCGEVFRKGTVTLIR